MISFFFKLIVMGAAVFCIFLLSETKEIKSVRSKLSIEKKRSFMKPRDTKTDTVRLFFYNSYGSQLVAEERNIQKSPLLEGRLNMVLSEFVKGPKTVDLKGFSTDFDVVRNVFLKEGVCYIDFSRNILSEFNYGIKAEQMFLRAVLKTCTEIPEIRKVCFLVNGESAREFKHLDINRVLGSDDVF